jgi:hypothetical protein
MIKPVGADTCSDCIVWAVGCDSNSECAELYLAQSGELSVTKSTTIADAGTFTGTLSNVHFVQWDFGTNSNPKDAPVPNGKCVDITHATFNATWP